MNPLWDFQQERMAQARAAFRTFQSVLLQSPTGSGKTQMGTSGAKSASEKGNDVIWMAHRRELLEGTSNTFSDAGVPHSVMMGGRHHNPRLRVTLASVGTLVNRMESTRPPKLLITDECHHAVAGQYDQIIRWVEAHGGKSLGLTATPWRLSGEGLDSHYQHMVLGPAVAWLIANGFLSDYRAYAPVAPDLTGVHTLAGDYVKNELEQVMTGKAIVADCVSHWRRLANGKRTIGFAVTVQHSQMMAEEFLRAGIPAAHIDADTPEHIRRQHILNFATGHLLVLWNCGLFSEGFDLSAIARRDVPIECVIQARPTKSLTMHLQQLGRALRRKPYPAILVDLCGNIARLGLPDHPHEWTLQGRPKKGRAGKGSEETPMTRKCQKCDVLFPIVLASCPHCGAVQQSGGGARKVEEVVAELKEIDREQARRDRLREQGKAESLQDLVDLGQRRGQSKPLGWACHVFISRLHKRGEQWEAKLLEELIEYGRRQNYRNPQEWASHFFTATVQRVTQRAG
ncbi:DEAD/DEAH box helicase [Gemmata sp. JC717]|uniref:DEAD/DEAH box helicase n=1 Tax=Gemmata algarum TaxID=2975278 RepID=UPI0021BA7976|nr:DEAD/DEAH box helicase [Gemmata algarum]MDY3551427.1 DEAD/DEAH box helicase [Gemmata algarum]